MQQPIKLNERQRSEMIDSLQTYFDQEKDEQLGDLAAGLLLDFIVEELGPIFYNAGIEASYQFMNEKIEDLFGIQVRER
ncbi:Uncharacterized conserved protein, DUF2164 family [Terribacillus halophilus]|uniref:Uncharacterized conserved protein, DUF2164 family n=1 Tax=Terribacillus halophilus TaxID=361279 RepID=A0A1G6TZ98_9BACI|nr:DUF2164 family protein [Terribacillus halophilus]SDD33677.1 Uncharacterized conserved protein, DUF2164 family [Terribacillus halophilus]